MMSNLIRASRKQLGLSQTEACEILELSQGALSKVENGRLTISAAQWYKYCDETGLSLDSVWNGYVDFKKTVLLGPLSTSTGYKTPARYAFDAGSTIRTVRPFLDYLEKMVGEKTKTKFLENLGFDLDFFICLDNHVNLNLILDITQFLAEKGKLNLSDLGEIAKSVSSPHMHGRVGERYHYISDPLNLLSDLISNAPLYECNFHYQISNRTSSQLDISVIPNAHIEKFKNHPSYQNQFLCHYRKEYFKHFTTFSGCTPPEVKEVKCISSGQNECTFQVDIQS